MKKSLIALAVAGLVSAPAFAATSNVDVYGVMNYAIQDTDTDNVDMDVVDNVSRIGFKGSEDLGGGLKAVWQIEQGINATADKGAAFGDGVALRNTFIGLAGGFGTAIIGRHDTPYKIATGKYDIFGDTIGDYNNGAGGYSADGVALLNKVHDARASNAIAYISPNFSGFTVAAAIVTSDDSASTTTLNVADKSVDAVSIAAMYANGPLTVDVAYQNVEDYSTAWKIGAGYKFGDLAVGAVYEDSDDAQEQQGWLLNAKYGMGPITLKAQYGQVEVFDTLDQDMWALGADYALSKRTTAYVVFASGDNDSGDDVSGWNLGVKHSF